MSSELAQERLQLGEAAVLSLHRAAELLPLCTKTARQWLRDQGLVFKLADKDVVIWGDALDRIRNAGTRHTEVTPPKRRPRAARKTAGLRRGEL